MDESLIAVADAFCKCSHRRWLHEGPSIDCSMAGCACRGFRLAPTEEATEEAAKV